MFPWPLMIDNNGYPDFDLHFDMERISEIEIAIASLERTKKTLDLEIERLRARLPDNSPKRKCVQVVNPFKKEENERRKAGRR